MSTVVAKLKGLMPYAAISLVLPGGSVVALLLWLYRRQGMGPVGEWLGAAWAWPHRLVNIHAATVAVNRLGDSARRPDCGEPHSLLTSRTRDSLQANEMSRRQDQRDGLDCVESGRVVPMKTEVTAIEKARCGNAPK
jgi:hypothetical protein